MDPTGGAAVDPTGGAAADPGGVTGVGTAARPGWRRWSRRILLVTAVAVTVMMATLAVAMRLNDSRIDADRLTATATVLTVAPLRTGVEFVTADGKTIRPPSGVLYPGLLSVGQRFIVEYSAADPTLVRVAGRTAAVGNIMIGIVLLITWLIAGPALLVLRPRPHAAVGSHPRSARR